uniref:hypothetical protein n=1 Tax=Amycolatopsis sp. CA-096443 TaxID=3239919 RepID=UPI003F497506
MRRELAVIAGLPTESGWLTEEMAAALNANPDFTRALMQDMARCGEAVADGTGRHWAPRLAAVATALTPADDRQVGMA